MLTCHTSAQPRAKCTASLKKVPISLWLSGLRWSNLLGRESVPGKPLLEDIWGYLLNFKRNILHEEMFTYCSLHLETQAFFQLGDWASFFQGDGVTFGQIVQLTVTYRSYRSIVVSCSSRGVAEIWFIRRGTWRDLSVFWARTRLKALKWWILGYEKAKANAWKIQPRFWWYTCWLSTVSSSIFLCRALAWNCWFSIWGIV